MTALGYSVVTALGYRFVTALRDGAVIALGRAGVLNQEGIPHLGGNGRAPRREWKARKK